MPVLLAALLLGLLNLTGSAMAQNGQESDKQFVPKKDCSYNFTDLPYNDIMESGRVGSLHEFVCRWAVIRDQPGASFALNTYLNPLDSLKVNSSIRSYLIEMEAPNMGDKMNWYDEVYVVVSSENGTYYDRFAGKKYEDGDPWHLRSFRTVDVPGAERQYLWSEFYKAYPDLESDTTEAVWRAYVHTFHPEDSPPLQHIDLFIPVDSSGKATADREPIDRSLIPIRHWHIVDDKDTQVSQIDIRFIGPKMICVTPRTDDANDHAWLGAHMIHSEAASTSPPSPTTLLPDTAVIKECLRR